MIKSGDIFKKNNDYFLLCYTDESTDTYSLINLSKDCCVHYKYLVYSRISYYIRAKGFTLCKKDIIIKYTE